MTLAEVKGNVVSAGKVDNLVGKKLLLVELLTVGEKGLLRTKKHMVCIDVVGAGEGELVVVVEGSSARLAPGMKGVATDAVIVGIVAAVEAHQGQVRIGGSTS